MEEEGGVYTGRARGEGGFTNGKVELDGAGAGAVVGEGVDREELVGVEPRVAFVGAETSVELMDAGLVANAGAGADGGDALGIERPKS